MSQRGDADLYSSSFESLESDLDTLFFDDDDDDFFKDSFESIVSRFQELPFSFDDELRVHESEQLAECVRDFVESSFRIIVSQRGSQEAEERVKQRDILVRLALRSGYHSPFSDVAKPFAELVSEFSTSLHVASFLPTPSRFIPPTAFDFSHLSKDQVCRPLQTEFTSRGHLRNVFLALNLQPRFATVFMNTYLHLMDNPEQPLPLHLRHYIAILASSRHHCDYLVRWQIGEFLRVGGDRSWIEDPSSVTDPRIPGLKEYHTLLVRRPWALRAEHLEGVVSDDETLTWNPHRVRSVFTVTEFIQVSLILLMFHQLASTVLGLGIVSETVSVPFENLDLTGEEDGEEEKEEEEEDGETFDRDAEHVGLGDLPPPPPENLAPPLAKIEVGHDGEIGARVIRSEDLELLRQLKSSPSSIRGQNENTISLTETSAPPPAPPPPAPPRPSARSREESLTDVHGRVVALAGPSRTSPPPPLAVHAAPLSPIGSFFSPKEREFLFDHLNEHHLESDLESQLVSSRSLSTRFLPSDDSPYVDYNIRKERKSYVSQFNFDDDCYSLLSTYDETLADLLQREFDLIQDLTDNTLFCLPVNTSKLRRACWIYIYRIFGMMKDDYDYRRINDLLHIRFKTYMKYVACYPQRVTKDLYERMGLTLSHKEKAHANMLITSARKHCSLMYVGRTISQFLTGESWVDLDPEPLD